MKIKIVSLGWGIQSFTLTVMSVFGDLEPFDYAIHADTNHERTKTYAFAEKWTQWLLDHGVKVITVKSENRGQLEVNGLIGIPARTASGTAVLETFRHRVTGEQISGSDIDDIIDRDEFDPEKWEKIESKVVKSTGGQLRRMCTMDWKIAPMRREITRLLAESKISKRRWEVKGESPVEMWLGISLDEFQRMKPSDVKYISNRWPLIEKKMTRQDCVDYLKSHGLEVPPKSYCVFCPYHSKAAWVEMKQEGGADWEKAVAVDERIRKQRPPFDLFLHGSRKPLAEAVVTPEESGQLMLEPDENEECSGTCFV